jgi:hypothetical protein
LSAERQNSVLQIEVRMVMVSPFAVNQSRKRSLAARQRQVCNCLILM